MSRIIKFLDKRKLFQNFFDTCFGCFAGRAVGAAIDGEGGAYFDRHTYHLECDWIGFE